MDEGLNEIKPNQTEQTAQKDGQHQIEMILTLNDHYPISHRIYLTMVYVVSHHTIKSYTLRERTNLQS